MFEDLQLDKNRLVIDDSKELKRLTGTEITGSNFSLHGFTQTTGLTLDNTGLSVGGNHVDKAHFAFSSIGGSSESALKIIGVGNNRLYSAGSLDLNIKPELYTQLDGDASIALYRPGNDRNSLQLTISGSAKSGGIGWNENINNADKLYIGEETASRIGGLLSKETYPHLDTLSIQEPSIQIGQPIYFSQQYGASFEAKLEKVEERVMNKLKNLEQKLIEHREDVLTDMIELVRAEYASDKRTNEIIEKLEAAIKKGDRRFYGMLGLQGVKAIFGIGAA